PADGNLEGETLNIKLANGAATLTVTVVTEEGPTAVVPENAQAAITGVDEGASSGVIKVVYQKTAARAAGSGPDGKPTLEEAVAVVEDHLTRELGYTFTKASSSGTTTYTLKDKFGYPAGTATWAENGSNVIEGARYQDAAKGYETISAADGGVAVTTGKYALVNGTTWTAVGDGSVKVAIGNTDTVKIEEFDGWVKIDGVQTGVNKTYGGSSNAMPSVKDLKVSGTGSGVAKTTAAATTYVAYNDATALAQGDELATGYVKLTGTGLTFDSTTAGSSKTFAKVGEEVTVNGATNGNSYRVSVEGGDAIDVTASGTSFKIPADKVTGDITVSDLIAHTLTKAITNGVTGMTATWYVNGDEVDFGANATKVVNLSATDKLTVKVTFADKIDKVNSASTGAKLTIKAGSADVSTAKWTGVGLGEATVASGVIEFEKTADIAAGTAVTGEAGAQASAVTMTVEYTASTT
ncbi:hypothetical protein D1646_21730, partial [Pseudoflavonifractor sp. 60]|uniref:hypothetical protein n=1 Tax=Pseudoflavonifractor sp. 60 TaxID=2304576 RepID=UPI001367A7B8